MLEIKSKNNNKLLHLVYKVEDFTAQRTELVEADNFIQCSYLKMEKGTTFKPHQHIWKSPSFTKMIAQESWVVIKGSVEVSFFDTDGGFLEKHVLNSGDSSFTLEGGHTYLILEDDTLVYEYKTGPYTGQQNDKTFI